MSEVQRRRRAAGRPWGLAGACLCVGESSHWGADGAARSRGQAGREWAGNVTDADTPGRVGAWKCALKFERNCF